MLFLIVKKEKKISHELSSYRRFFELGFSYRDSLRIAFLILSQNPKSTKFHDFLGKKASRTRGNGVGDVKTADLGGSGEKSGEKFRNFVNVL